MSSQAFGLEKRAHAPMATQTAGATEVKSTGHQQHRHVKVVFRTDLAPGGSSPVDDCSDDRTSVFGLSLAPVTMAEVIAKADSLIRARQPSYIITANLNYAMLTERVEALRAYN